MSAGNRAHLVAIPPVNGGLDPPRNREETVAQSCLPSAVNARALPRDPLGKSPIWQTTHVSVAVPRLLLQSGGWATSSLAGLRVVAQKSPVLFYVVIVRPFSLLSWVPLCHYITIDFCLLQLMEIWAHSFLEYDERCCYEHVCTSLLIYSLAAQLDPPFFPNKILKVTSSWEPLMNI